MKGRPNLTEAALTHVNTDKDGNVTSGTLEGKLGGKYEVLMVQIDKDKAFAGFANLTLKQRQLRSRCATCL